MKKKMLSWVLCLIILLTTVMSSLGVMAASADTYCDWATIQSCRTNKTAPVIAGTEDKVFAGWYKDAAYTTALKASEIVEGAYAKFVSPLTLTAQCQISATTTESSAKTNLRIVTTVDSLNYQSVGFDVTIGGKSASLTADTVYNTIYGFTDENKIKYTPSVSFKNDDSKHFMVYELQNIPNSMFAADITIVPKWTTLDGIVVTGTQKETSIMDGIKLTDENVLGTYDYSLSKRTIDFSLVDKINASDIKSIRHEDGVVISHSVSGNIVTISDDAVLNADQKTATGATTNVIVSTATTEYLLPLKVVTLAIRTTDDFYSLPNYLQNKMVQGYFVLSNDLDFAGLSEFATYCGSKQVGSGGNVGWRATFDGQNHVIKNLTLATGWNSGVFGTIGFGGTVKNVAFTGAVNKAYGGFVCDNICGTLENVYVEGICTQSGYKTEAQLANCGSLLSRDISYAGATVKNITVVATGAWNAYNRSLATSGTTLQLDGTTIVIGPKADQIFKTCATIAEVEEANANVKAYETIKDVITDGISANGSVNATVTNGIIKIYFGSTCVYEIANEVTLDSYDYSLGKATIDFSVIAGVDASDITSISHEDGTEISYTVDGQVATISGDSILNADGTTATGATTTVVVTTEFVKYKLPLKVVTLAIRTTDDFYSLPNYLQNKMVQGYFVLSNDLDFAGLSEFATYCGSKQVGSGGNVGWRATFDGQNHVIKNLTLATGWNSGVFGTIGFGGTVKNVAFTGAINKAYGGFVCDNICGVLENIYVAGICTQSGYKTDAQIANIGTLLSRDISYAGATVKNITVVATGTWNAYNRSLATSGATLQLDGSTVVIGPKETQIYKTCKTIAEIEALNTNLKAFATAQAAAAANLASYGSVTYVTQGNAFVIKWNGTEIYRATIN